MGFNDTIGYGFLISGLGIFFLMSIGSFTGFIISENTPNQIEGILLYVVAFVFLFIGIMVLSLRDRN